MREVIVTRYITTVVKQTVTLDVPDHVLVDDYFDPFDYGVTGKMVVGLDIIEEVLDTTGWREQQQQVVFSPVQILPPGTVDRDPVCPTCGKNTAHSEEWSTGQCDDCMAVES